MDAKSNLDSLENSDAKYKLQLIAELVSSRIEEQIQEIYIRK